MDNKSRSKCKNTATRLLSRREHSVSELRRKLLGKGHNREDCDFVAAELVELGLLSDLRYAEALFRYKTSRGYGPVRIQLSLDKADVDKSIIDFVIRETDFDWKQHLCEQISKKFGEFPAESFKEWAKRARFFSNRGFSNDLIREVLHYSD
jgi:regulatory protein